MYDPLTLLAEEHRQDMLRQAERERLVKQIHLARPRQQAPVYRHALAAVGRRLAQWGEQLQTRYGDAAHTLSADARGID
ncbi:MAG: hypothetical protein HZC41_05725 [Chloroflexi bacterium]|nr:hypothetical protein [Chloroflexota bacterium]